MPATPWNPLPARFVETRDAMHTVAEHILAAYRYRAVGRIGLQPARGGIGTPLSDGRWIEITSEYPADLQNALDVLRHA